MKNFIEIQKECEEAYGKYPINKRFLYDIIRQVKEMLGIRGFYSPFMLCDELKGFLDVIFHKFNTKQIGGCLIKNTAPYKSAITINMLYEPKAQYFICYHELMHLLFHPCNTYMNCKGLDYSNTDYKEYFCNEGAAEWLVPYMEFLPYARQSALTFDTSEDIHNFKENAAKKFKVTPAVINFRLESLAYEMQQYFLGRPLDMIDILSKKEQLSYGIKIRSLNVLEDEMLHDEWEYRARIGG